MLENKISSGNYIVSFDEASLLYKIEKKDIQSLFLILGIEEAIDVLKKIEHFSKEEFLNFVKMFYCKKNC